MNKYKIKRMFDINHDLYSHPFREMFNIYSMFHILPYFSSVHKLIIRTVLDIKNKNDYLGDYNKHIVGDIRDIIDDKLRNII